MASIEKRQQTAGGKITWRAHYRDPDGKLRSKSFERKIDAQRFITSVESAKHSGSYIDPARARLTVGEWVDEWAAGQLHWKPSTRERNEGLIREHVKPRWEKIELAKVTHRDVQRWIAELADRRSPSTVRKLYNVMTAALNMAVNDGRLARNPAAGIALPRVTKPDQRYLTHTQVAALADAVMSLPVSKYAGQVDRSTHRLVVLFLAYTGLRWGEMAALRVDRLDLMRRRVTVAESVTLVRGVQTWGTPKGHERRDVPVPRFLVDDLAAHVAGKAPSDLVFAGDKGGALRSQVFQRAVLTEAAEAIGVPGLHPHELRHTAASLAIASGANVKVVQQMLGHKSATMTLDLYGHLFPDQLDAVGDAVDAARTAELTAEYDHADEAGVAYPLPTASVLSFPNLAGSD